jgi:hypothetical protein
MRLIGVAMGFLRVSASFVDALLRDIPTLTSLVCAPLRFVAASESDVCSTLGSREPPACFVLSAASTVT